MQHARMGTPTLRGNTRSVCYTGDMKREHSFSVVLEHDKAGYFVSCPELQGCYSQGKTYEEAMRNIKDAIRLHVMDIISEGERLPSVDSVSISRIAVAI